MNDKNVYSIGFDIGGTKCAVCLGKHYDNKIEIVKKKEVETLFSPQATFDKLSSFIQEVTTLAISKGSIPFAGISCGGPLDSVKGIILSPPNLIGWHNFHIVDYIQKRFSLKAKLLNDANACAFAEWKYGAGRGSKNMIFLTFGTGLGAGIILDGKVYIGSNDNAGEVGHIRLRKSGPIGYTKAGSFEGFCSGNGIAQLALKMAQRKKENPKCIVEMQNDGGITAKKICMYATNGDTFAKEVYKKSGQLLGEGLSIIIDILNPEKIVLGGVFMRAQHLLIPSMMKTLKKEALRTSLDICEILPAQLNENIGDYAALCVAREI